MDILAEVMQAGLLDLIPTGIGIAGTARNLVYRNRTLGHLMDGSQSAGPLHREVEWLLDRKIVKGRNYPVREVNLVTPEFGANAWTVQRIDCRTMSGNAIIIVQPTPTSHARGAPSPESPLTEREAQVAHFLVRGASVKEVAAALGTSVHTARRHTERVYRKLSVHSRLELVRYLGKLSGARHDDRVTVDVLAERMRLRVVGR